MFILCQRFLLVFWGEVEISSHTHHFHSLCQDQSTVAQQHEMTVAKCSLSYWCFINYTSLYHVDVPKPIHFAWTFKIAWVYWHPQRTELKKMLLPHEKLWVTAPTSCCVRFPLRQYGCAQPWCADRYNTTLLFTYFCGLKKKKPVFVNMCENH